MSEQESCPACGALPCDWVWNPRTDTESELVAARARIAELEATAARAARIWRIALEDEREPMRVLDSPEDQYVFMDLEKAVAGTLDRVVTSRTNYAYLRECEARLDALTTVTEDDVEAVARVLASFDVGYDKAKFSDENWQDYTGDARAALAAFISRKGSAQPEAGTEPGERGNGE